MHEVVCAGMLVADVLGTPVARLPEAGAVTLTPGFLMSAGGGAANTAIALSILGCHAAVAGMVGTDMLGDFVISELNRCGIGVDHIRRTSRDATSCTVVVNVEGEDRRYLHSIGANADYSLAHFDTALLHGAKLLYFGGYLIMPSFTSRDLASLFRGAKRRGITTVLDVVMTPDTSFDFNDIARALEHADYFLPNEAEARLLTGRAHPENQAEMLSALNSDCTVVITRGRYGSVAMRRNELIVTPAFPVTSVHACGAGDAFAAGLITGILDGWDLEYSLLFASAIGASRTRALNCFDSVFTFDEAVALLKTQTPALGAQAASV